MEWTDILSKIIISIVGVIVSGLGTLLMSWVSSKMKQEKNEVLKQSILKLIQDAVDYVCQTYVDNLKYTVSWNNQTMNEASKKALEYIEEHLNAEMIDFLTSQFAVGMEQWIEEQIEIAVQKSKQLSIK